MMFPVRPSRCPSRLRAPHSPLLKAFRPHLALTLAGTVLALAAGMVRPAAAAPEPRLVARAAIVVDADTGRVLYEKNADEQRPVASTQKLLTTLIIAEDGRLDEDVVTQADDAKVSPTKLYLTEGERFTRRQLVEVLLIRSFNDVARCLARDYAGSEENFAEVMNARARLLGMRHSQFKNASGLPADDQYSTARDMALLARAAHSNPVIREIIATESVAFKRPGRKAATYSNSNRLLGSFEWCDGMKTGFTNAAGRCLVSSATRNGRTVIVVALGSTGASIWNDSRALLELGLDEVAPLPPDSHARTARVDRR